MDVSWLDREILRALDGGPMSASELVERLGVEQGEVQERLEYLIQAGRVSGRKFGEQVVYWPNGKLHPMDVKMAMDLVDVQLIDEIMNLRKEIRRIWEKLEEISSKIG